MFLNITVTSMGWMLGQSDQFPGFRVMETPVEITNECLVVFNL